MSNFIQDYPYTAGKRKPNACEPVLSNEKLQEIKQSIEKYLPQSVNRKGANMNDYKKLIEVLKIRSETNHNGNWWDNAVADDIDRAIDAIEQLVRELDAVRKERDELYMEVMDCTKKIGCKAIEQVKKERDAAEADIHFLIVKGCPCTICSHYFSEDSPEYCLDCHSLTPYGNYKWRGVQE